MEKKRINNIIILSVLLLVILGVGGYCICNNTDLFVQKNYKKSVRFKKSKYSRFNIEDEYVKTIIDKESSAEKNIPYEYRINSNKELIGSMIGVDGYPLKRYGKSVKKKIAANIIHLSFSHGTLLFLDDKNKLYGMGWNRSEELRVKMSEEERTSEITGVICKPVFIMSDVTYMTNKNETGTVIVLKKDNTVWTWGSNGGLLGYEKDNMKVRRNPKKILKNIRFITSKGYNAAAISKNNDLYLWGDNAYGQLGNGKKGGYYGMLDEYEYIPQKTMSDVARVEIKEGTIIVTRLDGSKWKAGIGSGEEKATDGKKIGTKFVRIKK